MSDCRVGMWRLGVLLSSVLLVEVVMGFMGFVGRVLGDSIEGRVVDGKLPAWIIGDWDGLLVRVRGNAWFLFRWFRLRVVQRDALF